MTKLGAWTLTLAAAESYTGGTVISQGTLQLSSIGSLNGTSNINIAAGATFIVPASYTINAGATLTANSGATTSSAISGTAINLGSNPIMLNYDGAHPALVVWQGGTLTLNGNAFTVNGPPLPVSNTYLLIQQSSGSIASSGTYTVSGTAIGPGNRGYHHVSGGSVMLNIVATVNLPAAQPADLHLANEHHPQLADQRRAGGSSISPMP